MTHRLRVSSPKPGTRSKSCLKAKDVHRRVAESTEKAGKNESSFNANFVFFSLLFVA